jgi:uncharacterized protein YpuA (DUF1002 family)
MLLIGLKSETTGVGHGEDNLSSVTHQRMDIIAGGENETIDTLTNLYNDMVKNGEKTKKNILKIQDDIDSDYNMTVDEYERHEEKIARLRRNTEILKYDKILIVEGIILK